MTHPRQVIRKAAVAALVGKTAAEDRVFSSRVTPYHMVELPVLSVFAAEESVSPDAARSPRILDRVLQLAIEGAVKLSENVDDAIDDIAEQIENVMHFDATLGGVCDDLILDSTDLDILEEGDIAIGMFRLVFTVTYRSEGWVSQAPAEFKRAGVSYAPAGPKANDVVNLES